MQQHKPNFLEGVDGLFQPQQQMDGLKQTKVLITAQKTFQQRLRQRGLNIDDVTPPKFKMGEAVYYVVNQKRSDGVITQVPSGETPVLYIYNDEPLPWKTFMQKNPYFQDIPGSGSVWNMNMDGGERLYLIHLDDGTISSAFESDLQSNIRQQPKKQQMIKISKPLFKIGDKVSIKDAGIQGKIVKPDEDTYIHTPDGSTSFRLANFKEIYSEDEPNSGSLVYKPDQTRIYFIETNGKIYYHMESALELAKQQQSRQQLTQTQPKRQQLNPESEIHSRNHNKQSFVKRAKEFMSDVSPTTKAKFKVGDDVVVDISDNYHFRRKYHNSIANGKIVEIPKDGTKIWDDGPPHRTTWEKNINSNINLDLIESFADQPGTGSVWYFSRIRKLYNGDYVPIAYRKYFVKLNDDSDIYLFKQNLLKKTGWFW